MSSTLKTNGQLTTRLWYQPCFGSVSASELSLLHVKVGVQPSVHESEISANPAQPIIFLRRSFEMDVRPGAATLGMALRPSHDKERS
jgi:hypothetical protein